jgi:pimeloyl-ACP methyl ester carboxylesterase
VKLIARAFAFGALVLLLLAAGAAMLHFVSSRFESRVLAPPGRLVDVGGHRLFVRLSGPDGAPVVVLEAGGGSFSGQWAWVGEALSGKYRVVAYDRAGLGWSEGAGRPKDAKSVAAELRALLDALNLSPPYVLVGHSLGGLYLRVFAWEHPDRVAGVVLVDPADERIYDLLPALEPYQRRFQEKLAWAPWIARTGVLRFMPAPGAMKQLPRAEMRAARHLLSDPRHLQTFRRELAETLPGSESSKQAADARAFPGVPVIVLSAGEVPAALRPPDGFIEALHAAHAQLAAGAGCAEHRIVRGADHYSLVTDPQFASRTVAAVAEIFERRRGALAAGEPVC